MKYAADFRRIGRESLRGKWGVAILAGLIASALGATASGGPQINFNFDGEDISTGIEFLNHEIFSSQGEWASQLGGLFLGGAAVIALIAIAVTVALFIVCSVVKVGYSRFNLELVDRAEKSEINTLFKYFPFWKTAAAANFLQGLYVLLWSLLLIIPGIMASYSYAMIPYILAEHPELPASEALYESKRMMQGNRGRLFCLQCSFLGWALLSLLTLGIGSLWLVPYTQTATAAFYREISSVRSAE